MVRMLFIPKDLSGYNNDISPYAKRKCLVLMVRSVPFTCSSDLIIFVANQSDFSRPKMGKTHELS